METLSLDRVLIERLIAERFPTKAAFYRKGAVDKATLGRWYAGKNRPSAAKYLAFCGALDVDPLALLAVQPERMPAHLLRAIEGIRTGQWTDELSTLSFYQDLLPAPFPAKGEADKKKTDKKGSDKSE